MDPLSETERERWRGGVDKEIAFLHLDSQNQWERIGKMEKDCFDRIDVLRGDHQALALIVSRLGTKIAIFASLGAFLGSGLMSIVVGWLLKR